MEKRAAERLTNFLQKEVGKRRDRLVEICDVIDYTIRVPCNNIKDSHVLLLRDQFSSE